MAVTHAYAQAGPIRRAVRRVATFGPMAWLSARILPGLDALIFRVTRGRLTFSAWATGLPVIVLQTTGATSGLPRRSRVLAVPDGEGLLVVASNFGQRHDPAWCHNLRVLPQVSVASGADADHTERRFIAQELTGAERERGFHVAIMLNPGWRNYQKRAGVRVIPVFHLAPVAAATPASTPVAQHDTSR